MYKKYVYLRVCVCVYIHIYSVRKCVPFDMNDKI